MEERKEPTERVRGNGERKDILFFFSVQFKKQQSFFIEFVSVYVRACFCFHFLKPGWDGGYCLK